MKPSLCLTVAICTWNRCALLARTLGQMTRLEIPPGVAWELLVVNNRSMDTTDEVIESFQGRLPIRRLWEPALGLSSARNRALAEAMGDYILWTDDDVLVEHAWLAGYAAAFRRWPEADVFGGPIEPLFEGEPPDWLEPVHDHLGGVFGRQDLGPEPVRLTVERVREGPFGGNMAMRLATLRRFPFDPALGVRGNQYVVGEETEVIRTMLSAGCEGWWTPEARVHHWIPRRDQTLAQVRRWMVGYGRYKARVRPDGAQGSAGLSLGWTLFWMIRHELRFQLRRHFLPPEAWILDLIHASQARGRLLAALTRPPSAVRR